MTYAIIKSLRKRTHYFNVVGKPETYNPIDVYVTLVSLHADRKKAVAALPSPSVTRLEAVNFPLGEDLDERYQGAARVEITSYEVVELAPGAYLSVFEDLETTLNN
jgi:hypothetical protein